MRRYVVAPHLGRFSPEAKPCAGSKETHFCDKVDRGGFKADLATLECVTSSFPTELGTDTNTPVREVILDQTTHRGTPKCTKARPNQARRTRAQHANFFETFPLFFLFLLPTEGRLQFGGVLT